MRRLLGSSYRVATIRRFLACAVVATSCSFALAQTQEQATAGAEVQPAGEKKESPWIIAPVFNANPKVGFALGALTGYIHYFDEKSRPSIFAGSMLTRDDSPQPRCSTD